MRRKKPEGSKGLAIGLVGVGMFWSLDPHVVMPMLLAASNVRNFAGTTRIKLSYSHFLLPIIVMLRACTKIQVGAFRKEGGQY